MAQNQATNENGVQAPARLKRVYWSTYFHIPSGKNYRQENPGTDNNWVEIVEGSTPLPPPVIPLTVPLGKSLFVSSAGKTIANGAVPYDLVNHFSSMAEAKSVAQIQDTIYVYGDQTPNTNLYKDGVTWHFLGSNIISNNQPFFNDGGVAGTCIVRGNASFTCPGGAFNFSGVGTVIDIECYKVSATSGVAFQMVNTFGVVNVADTTFAQTGAAVYVDQTSNVIFNSKTISNLKNNGVCVNVRPAFTGKLIINANLITATPTVANSMVALFTQVGSTGRTIINVSDEIKLLGSAVTSQAVLVGNGHIIINGNVDGGAGNAFGIEQTPELFCHNGDAYNDGSEPLVSITGADACILDLNGTYTSSNADVILQNNVNSKLTINGKIVNTKSDGGSAGVRISGNSETIFDNVKIIMTVFDGSEATVDAAAAKNIKIIHSLVGNVDLDAVNITNLIGYSTYNFDAAVN